MAYKFIAVFGLLTVAKAGVIGKESHPTYSDATAVSYSSLSSPTHPQDAAPVASRAPAHYAPVYRPASYEQSTRTYKSFEVPAQSFKVAAPSFKVAAPSFKVPAPSFKVAAPVSAEESAPAHYTFGYEVNDVHTGDMHGQQETREGDVVRGSYYLMEADGSKRIVEYTADAHSGFNAVVRREENAGPVKSAAPQAAHGYAVGRSYEPAAAKAGFYSAPSVSYAGPSATVGRQQASSYYH